MYEDFRCCKRTGNAILERDYIYVVCMYLCISKTTSMYTLRFTSAHPNPTRLSFYYPFLLPVENKISHKK